VAICLTVSISVGTFRVLQRAVYNRVINRMLAQGKIKVELTGQGDRQSLSAARSVKRKPVLYYFYSYVFQELENILGEQLAREGNFIIKLSWIHRCKRRQKLMLRNSVNNAGSSYGFSQGAVVTLISHWCSLALTGGTDYKTSQFNRATQAHTANNLQNLYLHCCD